MIRLQVIRDLLEAKNMALKAEFMMQDRRRIESFIRNYESDISEAQVVEELTDQEQQPLKDRLREEKVVGK